MRELIKEIKDNQLKIKKETIDFLQESFFLKGRTPFDTISMIPDNFLEKEGLMNFKKDFIKLYSKVQSSKEDPLLYKFNKININEVYNDAIDLVELISTIDLVEEVSKIIPDKLKKFSINLIITKEKQTKASFSETDKNLAELTINLNSPKDEIKASIFHELGHMIEYFNPEILEKSRAFLKTRIFSEDKVSFDELQEEYSLRKEKRYSGFDLYSGEFIDPYVGRTYGEINDKDLLTEVISIGFQAFFYDWKNFLIKDPIHFELILDIITDC